MAKNTELKEQQQTEFPIRLTERALSQALRLREKEKKNDHFLRIGVKGGGCSGLEYVLKFDTKQTPYDIQENFGDLTVVVDAKSAVYLRGSVLDFTGALIGGGFQFQNPNAVRECGCGTSFTPKIS
jgi:iron-sulfur cluster assembly protein